MGYSTCESVRASTGMAGFPRQHGPILARINEDRDSDILYIETISMSFRSRTIALCVRTKRHEYNGTHTSILGLSWINLAFAVLGASYLSYGAIPGGLAASLRVEQSF